MLPQIVLDWLDRLRQDGKSHHTIQAYRRGIQHFLVWYMAVYQSDFHPAQVMPRDIRDWQAHQQQTEQSAPATTNQRLVAVKRFFKWAHSQQVVQQNPATDISTIRISQREIKSLGNVSLRRLLRAARSNIRDYAMLEVLVGTGIRVSELLNLKIGDLEMQPRSGKLTVRFGKGGGYREIPLTRDVRHAVQAYLDYGHPDPDDPQHGLWIGQGTVISHRSSITRMIDKYAIRAGLDRVSPHMLRHTFATRYLKANPDDLRGLARLLGHANLNSVMLYTEPTMTDLAERMACMDAGVDLQV